LSVTRAAKAMSTRQDDGGPARRWSRSIWSLCPGRLGPRRTAPARIPPTAGKS
jgi:hypothetical protein